MVIYNCYISVFLLHKLSQMLLFLLSIVAVTLAYPQTHTDGPKFLTNPISKPSNTTLEPETYLPSQEATTNLSTTDTKDRGNCTCVPYYICDEGDMVFESYGTLTFDSYCVESVDVCCKNPKPELFRTPIPKVKRGCGYRNPQGLQSFPSKNSWTSGETPWVVALMVGNTTVGLGALVHPQVVLTAAHVAEQYFNTTLIVRAGDWHAKTDKQRLASQEGPVETMKIHNDFNKGNLMYDIALLRLQTPMKLADHINVICLPDQEENFDHSRGCIVNGWKKNDSGAVSLKKVEADILDSESCNAKLKSTRLGKWFKLHKSFVCAEERKGFTCKGDGGAPLVCPSAEAYKVCGLVAWGIDCGTDVPAVYARVAMFRDWVDDTMREWGFGAEEWF